MRLKAEAPGPTLIVLGAIHGNEPAGLHALEPLADLVLEAGDFVALSGNRAALAEGVRYLERDLNRGWSAAALAELPARGLGTAEDDEQRDLLGAIDDAVADARGPVYFLDLHTTSADGHPFVVVGDDPAHRAFAHAFGLPVFLGLVGKLSGALTPFLCTRGITAIAIEGGQNDDEWSVVRHTAAIRIALVECGLLSPASLGPFNLSRRLLEHARASLPREIEIVSRYAITPEDEFVMQPGFSNIHPVRAGTLLARDRHGDIRAPADGLVVMPLYQGQGDDGFFMGRAVAP
jgi:succinylglutamate desuccinylase